MKAADSPQRAYVDGQRNYYSQLSQGTSVATPNTLLAVDLVSGNVDWQLALKPRNTTAPPPGAKVPLRIP